MNGPVRRAGTHDALIKTIEAEAKQAGKRAVYILRDLKNGNYAEVFNNVRGIDFAKKAEILEAIKLETNNPTKDKEYHEFAIDVLSKALKARVDRERENAERALLAPERNTAGEALSMQAVGAVVTEIVRPLIESMGKMMKQNTEAIEQIALSMDVMRNRVEAMEKQMRLQTPVTDRQARYLADAARDKARELLDKKGINDKKVVTKLSGMIKKSVLSRNGIGSLRELPRCEYNVAMSQIETWTNGLAVLEIVREARDRAEAEGGGAT